MNDTNYIFRDLNDRQREAVEHIDGPILILAGAGSGKTKTLTHRIANLIASGIPPYNILSITFTNKAAQEMRERISKLLNTDPTQPTITLPYAGTFHSMCLRILRQEAELLGYERNFVVYDSDDQQSLVKTILNDLALDSKRWNPKTMLNKISQLKNELITPDEYLDRAKEYQEKILASIYEHYQSALKSARAMDFDDLIMQCVILFQKNPDVLKKYQDLFRYILIDEYQDTNKTQYTWVNLLAKEHRNLAIVGDDAQSIYGWRQADIRNILNFEKDYPEAKVILLEQNYRSTKLILEAANTIIANNEQKKEKNLWTDNPEGEKIHIKEIPHERDEAHFIAKSILQIAKEKKSDQCAILYRTHAQSRAIEEALIRYGLPYRIIGGLKFYQRREVKDILAYARLALNQNDSVSVQRIYNVPTRGVGTTSFQAFLDSGIPLHQVDAETLEASVKMPTRSMKAFLSFVEIIRDLNDQSKVLNTTELIRYIIKKTGYDSYINDGTPEGEVRWENVKELFTATKKYDSFAAPEGLEKFLEEVALIQEADNVDSVAAPIQMMTIHSAKGLEFPVVFVAGLEEGIFPHSRALFNTKELEEERRLCYVAVTRARTKLYLTYCRQRTMYGSTQMYPPSRFIFEIPKHLLNFTPLTEKFASDFDSIVDYKY